MGSSKWNIGQKRPACRRKRVIVIASEGEVTEPEYFQKLNSMSQTVVFSIVENLGGASDPKSVLARMKNHLKNNPLEDGDEAWIVVDRDQWPDADIQNVKKWANGTNRYYAISIKRFEDWLKLHVSAKEKKKYRQFLIGKTKHVPDGFLTKQKALDAMETAEKLYSTERSVGNVFKVLKSFFRASCPDNEK